MAPTRTATKSLATGTPVRQQLPELKKKSADSVEEQPTPAGSVEDQPFGSDEPVAEPVAEAEADEPVAEPVAEADVADAGAIVPVLTDGLIAVKTEHDDADGRRNAKKGEGMNPLDVSRMLTMLKKRTKSKDR